MTFRIFLELLAFFGGLTGIAFLWLYFRRGIPGKASLPRPVRFLITIALATDAVAAIFYATLILWRIAIQNNRVADGTVNQIIATFIVGLPIAPTVALLVVLLYVHFSKKGRNQGWIDNGRNDG